MPGDALLDLVYPADTRDKTWKRQALCMKPNEDVPKGAWSCDDGPKSKVLIAGISIHGFKAQQMAAMICFTCPAQWGCARYALEGDEAAGVWSMTMRDLKWLRDTCSAYGMDPVGLVEAAEELRIPVQSMVLRLREELRPLPAAV